MAAGKSVLTGGERGARWFRRTSEATPASPQETDDLARQAPVGTPTTGDAAGVETSDAAADAAAQWQREDLLAWLAEYEAQNAMLRRQLTAARTAPAPIVPPCTHTWETSPEGVASAAEIEALRAELDGQRRRADAGTAEVERLAARHAEDTARSAAAHAAAADEVRSLRARLAATEETTTRETDRLRAAVEAARADAAAAKERHRKALDRGRQQRARADELLATARGKAEEQLAAARSARAEAAAHVDALETAQARIRELEAAAGAARVAAASRRPLSVVPGQGARSAVSPEHPAARGARAQVTAAH